MTAPWRLLCGDVVEVLRTLPSGSVAACVTDPPYGELLAAWDRPRPKGWYVEWLREVKRLLTPGGALICMVPRRRCDIVMGAIRTVFGDSQERPLQVGAWVHRQGFMAHPGILRPEHELFVVSGLVRARETDVRKMRSYQTAHNISRQTTMRRHQKRGFRATSYVPDEFGPVAGTVFESARNKPEGNLGHPCQKPERLTAYLVALASAPGDVVLDPFAGSGTTGAVAVSLGRRFVGIELSPEYCRMAEERIGSVQPLFDRAEVAS